MDLLPGIFHILTFFMFIISGKGRGRESSRATKKAHDMVYGDSVLLSLFIVHFRCFELKHFDLLLFITFKVVKQVAIFSWYF